MIVNQKHFTDLKFVFLAFVFAALPVTGLAASVYFDSDSQNVNFGDIFVVEAKISSPDEPINVVDGMILFDPNILAVKELSTGASVLNVWAEQPVFSNETGRINFVGGALDGFRGE